MNQALSANDSASEPVPANPEISDAWFELEGWFAADYSFEYQRLTAGEIKGLLLRGDTTPQQRARLEAALRNRDQAVSGEKPQCPRHEPDPATTVRERDGLPADLLNYGDYPVAAACQLCDARIVSYGFTGEWHDPGDPHPSAAPPAAGTLPSSGPGAGEEAAA